VPSGGLLGEYDGTVDRHLEETARGLEQSNFSIRIRLLELSRQTGGSGLVVSDNTVLDHDTHKATRLRVRSTTARIVVAMRRDAKGIASM
jgi:hypothetical protein